MKTGLDDTEDSFRARQQDPGVFDGDSFRTISLSGGKESTGPIQIREKLTPFQMRVLAAYPGKSLNNRIYTRELLQQITPFYNEKPFILDHDIEDSAKVVGFFKNPRYATETGMDGRAYEGLWLDGVGLMDEDLFQKVSGSGLVPPLIRGFSIGGEGEGVFQDDGILIKHFTPVEGSLTAFPGIPSAHIASIHMLRESFKRQEAKKKMEIVERDIPLREAEKQATAEKRRLLVREGPIPDQDSGTGTRQRNDVRPGLPTPGRGKPVTHQQPAATTSADTGLRMDPEQHSTGGAPMAATGSPGPSTEMGPLGTSSDAAWQAAGQVAPIKGSKKATPQLSGTVTAPGQPSDFSPVTVTVRPAAEAEEPPEEPDEDPDKPKEPPTEEDDPHMPGMPVGKEDPAKEPGEEEEEEEERLVTRLNLLWAKLVNVRAKREAGPSPHIPGEPIGKTGPHAAPEEEEEEEEKGKHGLAALQRMNPAPTKEESQPAPGITILLPDSVPIEARASALMFNPTILQNARMQMQKDSEKKALEMINAWNKGKEVKEPMPRITVRPDRWRKPESKAAVKDKPPGARPYAEQGVPTKSITNVAPTIASTGISTINSRAEELLQQLRRDPLGQHNLGGRVYRKLVPEILNYEAQ